MRQKKIISLILGLTIFTVCSYAQSDSAKIAALQKIFGMAKFKVDTTAVKEDSLTKKIFTLRAERGPVNLDNVLKFIIQNKEANDTVHSKKYYDALSDECQNGHSHQLIENILINLYRQCFTEPEIDQLILFYKSSAGKKMSNDFMVLSITAAMAAQEIVKATADKLDMEMKVRGKMK